MAEFARLRRASRCRGGVATYAHVATPPLHLDERAGASARSRWESDTHL